MNLVGTKYGCGVAQCGACTIHYNGSPVRSCQFPVSAVGNGKVVTIEGLSENGDHPVQQAWIEMDVAQCGYCQAGQIMAAAALLKKIRIHLMKRLIQRLPIFVVVVPMFVYVKPFIWLHQKEVNHE